MCYDLNNCKDPVGSDFVSIKYNEIYLVTTNQFKDYTYQFKDLATVNILLRTTLKYLFFSF